MKGRTPPRFCAIVQLLQLDVSVLGLPVPLLPAGLGVLRCPELVLLAGLVQVRHLQLRGGLVPTLEVELGVGELAHFDNLNINLVKKRVFGNMN